MTIVRLARPPHWRRSVWTWSALTLLALPVLLLPTTLTGWWRWPCQLVGIVLLAAGIRGLRVSLARRRVDLDMTTLTVHDRTHPGPKTFSRRDVLGADLRRSVLHLRLRRDEAGLALRVRDPQAARRTILEWIGKGPAAREARELLMTRMADAVTTAMATAVVPRGKPVRTHTRSARPRTTVSRSTPAPHHLTARQVLLTRLATALRTAAGVNAPTMPAPACTSQPATTAARRLALTRLAIALRAAATPASDRPRLPLIGNARSDHFGQSGRISPGSPEWQAR